MKYIDIFLKSIMNKVPDLITGKSKEYEKELYLLYGNHDNGNTVFSMKFRNFKRYVSIIAALILLISCFSFLNVFQDKSYISLDKQGQLYIERPTYDQGNISVKLIISGDVEGNTVKKPVTLNIKPEGINSIESDKHEKKASLQEIAISKLNSVVYQINKSDDTKVVYLPGEIEGIKNVIWKVDNNNPILLIIFIGILVLISIYLKRYDEIRRLKKKCNDSIEEELPDFLNKVVLLMNAGLVLSTAFKKIVEDYNANSYKDKSYFYNQLTELNNKVNETNSSMEEEFKRFAERSKNREFMRITNVIADNIHKGTELVNILHNESSFLWFQRKKRAEEKGRIAETKLTMPLALQLLALVLITLAPAMIEM